MERVAYVVFPAWAGMNRRTRVGKSGIRGVPRVGGDEPSRTGERDSVGPCSPRGRG